MLKKFLTKARLHFDLADFLMYWLAKIYVNRIFIPKFGRNQNHIVSFNGSQIKGIIDGDWIIVNIQYHDGQPKRFEPDFGERWPSSEKQGNRIFPPK